MSSSRVTLLALLLSGCVNLNLGESRQEGPVITHYVLDDMGRAVVEEAPTPKTLILLDARTAAFYDSDNMVFSKQPGTRAYYQFARWTERPGRRFTDLLIDRLDREKIFTTVVKTGTPVQGDWLLATEIIEFYHDAAKEPGVVKVLLRAEVTDLQSRRLLSRRTFGKTVPVISYDAKGAHEAFNQAVTMTLNEMVDWLSALLDSNGLPTVNP